MMTHFKPNKTQEKKTIVLPEGNAVRILEAACHCDQHDIAKIILLGDESEIHQQIDTLSLSLGNIQIIDYKNTDAINHFAKALLEESSKQSFTLKDAVKICQQPLCFANMLVKSGIADACVAGVKSTTGDVIRAALKIIGTKQLKSRPSSFFIMESQTLPTPVIFADCAMNISPTAQQLCNIAFQSSQSIKSLLGLDPKIAMLSFSTNGSATHKDVSKVISATQLIKEQHPDLEVIGEIQFDAAISNKILHKKWPNTAFEAPANVFIFPNLDAANLAYKVAEQFGQAKAIGPILQGFNKPINDLSRGAKVDDIINTIGITALQAEGNE